MTEDKGATARIVNGVFISGLTLLFIYLKLTKQIDWSWVWVLSPLWITAIVGIAILATLISCAFFIARKLK